MRETRKVRGARERNKWGGRGEQKMDRERQGEWEGEGNERIPAGHDPANEPENANQSHDAVLEIVHLRSNAAIPFPGFAAYAVGRCGSSTMPTHRRAAHECPPRVRRCNGATAQWDRHCSRACIIASDVSDATRKTASCARSSLRGITFPDALLVHGSVANLCRRGPCGWRIFLTSFLENDAIDAVDGVPLRVITGVLFTHLHYEFFFLQQVAGRQRGPSVWN